jgi:radical SAM protein with 4Fe4S-binding SPASM domain
MSLELGLKAINEAIKLGVEWISITGGEPFLEQELLMNLVEYAKSKGLKTEIVTNCYWAETLETAKYLLNSLQKIGLDVLNLSIDDFHQEYVPIGYTRNAYWAAKKLGVKVVIMTTTTKNNTITAKNIPELLLDENIQLLGEPRLRDPNALLIETPITPVGRGETIKELDNAMISEVNCGEVLRDIGIGPNGQVYPCCGPLAAKIILGNIKTSTLTDIIASVEKDTIFSSIREGVTTSGTFTSRCHACYSLIE